MTRTGKIARLPRAVREELNQRLLDGEAGPHVVAWLNAQAEVKAALAEHYAGREITVQNLSEWRAGGWGDWCRRRDALELVALAGEEADDFEALAGGARLADRFAQLAAVALIGQLRKAGAMKEGPAKLRAVLRVVAGLVRLRGSERQRERSVRAQELHEREIAEVDRVNARKAASEASRSAAEGRAHSSRIRPNPSKSDQIQPTASVAPVGAEPASGSLSPLVAFAPVAAPREVPRVGAEAVAVATVATSETTEVNPTKSDQIQPLEFQASALQPSEGQPRPVKIYYDWGCGRYVKRAA